MNINELKEKIDGLPDNEKMKGRFWMPTPEFSATDLKALSADHTRLAELVAEYEKLVEAAKTLILENSVVILQADNGKVFVSIEGVGPFATVFEAFDAVQN